ncbi:hypothetical protein FKX85_19725 [Echinicola soli]|uniref:Uncharacterized protein n=1 Tax=Echinicola soli TaxID=2591634 RepID=A0A514CMU2_9BACT|nr:hypothetical protein [Echinicola soli]QDH81139.1 hypothetical protein FKX85_19725 [Echinicola soli]
MHQFGHITKYNKDLKQNHSYLISACICLLVGLFISQPVQGQEYTSLPGCNQWNNAACWVKSNDPSGCSNNTSLFPPMAPATTGCEVHVVINGDMVISSGQTLMDGNLKSITIADGGSLTVAGDLTIAAGAAVSFLFDASQQDINIEGTLTLEENASLNVTGTVPVTVGAISNYLKASQLVVRGESRLFVDSRSGINISGTTKAHTPSNNSEDRALISVEGFFMTTSIYINGNSHLAFQVDEGAEVIASEPNGTLEMNGNSTLKFIGDVHNGGDADGMSYIDVGASLNSNGSGAKIIADDATLYTCGQFSGNVTKETENMGKFEEDNCRVLPVKFMNFRGTHLVGKKQIQLDWAVANDDPADQYIIQMAIDRLDKTETVAVIPGNQHVSFQKRGYTFCKPLENRFSNRRVYFRVSQVSADSLLTHSSWIAIAVPKLPRAGASWTLFPNPVGSLEKLTLRYTGMEVIDWESTEITLYTEGKILEEWTIGELHSPEVDLEVPSVPPGLVYLKVNWNGQQEIYPLLAK